MRTEVNMQTGEVTEHVDAPQVQEPPKPEPLPSELEVLKREVSRLKEVLVAKAIVTDEEIKPIETGKARV